MKQDMPQFRPSLEFQERWQKAVEAVFTDAGLTAPVFQAIDRYLSADFDFEGKRHTIEVYEDDVVIHEGERLLECYMREEHRSQNALITGFTTRLGRYLAGGPWAGPDEKSLFGNAVSALIRKFRGRAP